jgi:glycosyltransferase involved in cell wall biosynthesis
VDNPRTSVLIPAFNEERLLPRTLRTVHESFATVADRSYEIVVCDNNSTDRTAEVAASYTGVRVVDEKQKGLVSARDGGFRATTAELVANIDADTIVPPGWLDVVFGELEKDDQLVCLSGPYVYYDLSFWNQVLIGMFYGLTKLIYAVNRYVLRVGSVVQGGNFVLRRDAWIKAGGFNREIKFYGEDTDVAVRLSKVGKVKWTFRLQMKTSGRRLAEEGVFRTALTYTLNFFWVTFAGKPATKEHTDIRPGT